MNDEYIYDMTVRVNGDGTHYENIRLRKMAEILDSICDDKTIIGITEADAKEIAVSKKTSSNDLSNVSRNRLTSLLNDVTEDAIIVFDEHNNTASKIIECSSDDFTHTISKISGHNVTLTRKNGKLSQEKASIRSWRKIMGLSALFDYLLMICAILSIVSIVLSNHNVTGDIVFGTLLCGLGRIMCGDKIMLPLFSRSNPCAWMIPDIIQLSHIATGTDNTLDHNVSNDDSESARKMLSTISTTSADMEYVIMSLIMLMMLLTTMVYCIIQIPSLAENIVSTLQSTQSSSVW